MQTYCYLKGVFPFSPFKDTEHFTLGVVIPELVAIILILTLENAGVKVKKVNALLHQALRYCFERRHQYDSLAACLRELLPTLRPLFEDSVRGITTDLPSVATTTTPPANTTTTPTIVLFDFFDCNLVVYDLNSF
jgi:hypothetical protein